MAGNCGWRAAAAVDAVLADESQRVGQNVERRGEPPRTAPSETRNVLWLRDSGRA